MWPTSPCCASTRSVSHAALVEIAQQLVQVESEEILLRHRVHVAVEAVEHDHPHAVLLDALRDACARTRRARSRRDRSAASQTVPLVDAALEVEAQRPRPARCSVRQALVEREEHHLLAALRGAPRRTAAASVDLPVPAGPMRRVLVPRSSPPPSSESSSGLPLRAMLALERLPMLGRDQPREHAKPAALDRVVVVSRSRNRTPRSLVTAGSRRSHAELRRVITSSADHAVDDALHLHVGARVRSSSSSTVHLRPGEEAA